MNLREVRMQAWYPDLVEDAINRAEAHHGSLTDEEKIRIFYTPVRDFQQRYGSPQLVEYALSETLEKGVFDRFGFQTWHKYAAAVARKNERRFAGAGMQHAADRTPAEVLRRRELAIRELLLKAFSLYDKLSPDDASDFFEREVLTKAPSLTDLFVDADDHQVEALLRMAYKRMTSDWLSAGPGWLSYALDLTPDWDWPAEVPKPTLRGCED